MIFRAEPAVFNGWTERARRLLEDEPIGPLHAFLAVRDAFFAFMVGDDTEPARRRGADAVELARRLGLFDLEMLARSIDGGQLLPGPQSIVPPLLTPLSAGMRMRVTPS